MQWAPLRDGVVVIRLTTSQYTSRGVITTKYSADEIDAVAAYCEELEQCFLLPADEVVDKRQLHLRVSSPENSQRAALNWAADYDFSGAIAQLGERLTGSQKVGGSSPPGSTSHGSRDIEVGAHEFRNHFGWYMERAASGEEILITRRGKAYAKLVPPSPANSDRKEAAP